LINGRLNQQYRRKAALRVHGARTHSRGDDGRSSKVACFIQLNRPWKSLQRSLDGM
jgi:hypothetical protein